LNEGYYVQRGLIVTEGCVFANFGKLPSHGLAETADTFPSSMNSTAKDAKCAKIFDFLCGLRGLCGSEILSDINLIKPCLPSYGLAEIADTFPVKSAGVFDILCGSGFLSGIKLRKPSLLSAVIHHLYECIGDDRVEEFPRLLPNILKCLLL